VRAILLDRPAPLTRTPLRLGEVPLPDPGPGEVRVRVTACGVCRTDLHVVTGDLAPKRSPLIPGHQVVGRVDALGPGAVRFAVGERVGIAWLRSTCGVCPDCRAGRENLCPHSRYTGWDDDGGYAQAAIVPEAFAYSVPAAFDDVEAAPLLCAGIIGFRALERAAVPAGGRVLLLGFGSSAHLVLQLARARGHEVFVATRGERHRSHARALGADWVGDTFDPPPAPSDSAIVFAPAGEVVPAALRGVRNAGTVALAGVTLTPIPSMEYEPHLFHEKVLTSVESNTRRDGEALLAEAARAGIRPRTRTFPLEQAARALALLDEDGIEGTAVLVVS
jgi:propanol-preferring alcohol dehydrogenase